MDIGILPWSTSCCPVTWGQYDSSGLQPGWWCSLAIGSLCSVTASGEGCELDEAVEQAEAAALVALRRIDPSTLTLEQLALRAMALCTFSHNLGSTIEC